MMNTFAVAWDPDCQAQSRSALFVSFASVVVMVVVVVVVVVVVAVTAALWYRIRRRDSSQGFEYIA